MANDDLSKNDLAPDVKDDIENEDRLVDESNLDDLISQATLQYSLKNREGAAELYARATELQAEKNGEMSPDNADLLYAYGRCLYHLAVEKSDVLGTKVAGEKPIRKKDHTRTSLSEHDSQATNNQIIEDVVKTNIPTVSKDAQAPPVLKGEAEKASEPYFQFTGDENFDTSDEEDDQEEANEEPEAYADEEDDFANAYEILDMARVLLIRQVEQLESNDSHSSDQSVILRIRGLQERLADTYDLQAEISLEGERFSDAVVDLQSALGWKTRLFPLQSSLLAEAHYKLSLALEFASINRQPTGEAEANDNQVTAVDHGMRAEAAAEMEAAIRSCKLRISLEETELQKTKQTIEKAIGAVDSKNIGDVKEMVTEMELRLAELRQRPPLLSGPQGFSPLNGADSVANMVNSLVGKGADSVEAKLEQASKDANDLTRLVKRKRPGDDDARAPPKNIPISSDQKGSADLDLARSQKKAKREV